MTARGRGEGRRGACSGLRASQKPFLTSRAPLTLKGGLPAAAGSYHARKLLSGVSQPFQGRKWTRGGTGMRKGRWGYGTWDCRALSLVAAATCGTRGLLLSWGAGEGGGGPLSSEPVCACVCVAVRMRKGKFYDFGLGSQSNK